MDKASKDGEAGSVGGKGLQIRGANLALLRSSTHSPAFLYIMLAVIVLLTAIISYKFYFWFKYGKYISKGN